MPPTLSPQQHQTSPSKVQPNGFLAPNLLPNSGGNFAAKRRLLQPRPSTTFPRPTHAPIGEFLTNSETFAQRGSRDVLPIHIGNIWQCGRGDTGSKSRRDALVPRDVRTAA